MESENRIRELSIRMEGEVRREGEGGGDGAELCQIWNQQAMLGIHQNVKSKEMRWCEPVESSRATYSTRFDSTRFDPITLLLVLIRLVKEEIGGQLFVLVTGEVGLDDGVPGEAKTAELGELVSIFHFVYFHSIPLRFAVRTTYTLDSIPLLLRNGDSLCTRRQSRILIITLFT